MSAVFSRISRYRDLPDVVIPDARGRAAESRSLRLLPETEAALLHTVEEGDRLDHLADRYLGQPRSWWHIADANPEFLSPQALLGRGPEAAVEIPVAWEGWTPPWAGLLRALRDAPGVESAALGTAGMPEPAAEVQVAAEPALELDPALSLELSAGVPMQEVRPAVAEAMRRWGVSLSPDVRLEMPDGATWVLADRGKRRVWAFALFASAGSLRVHEAVPVHLWAVRAGYNRLLASAEGLLARVEARGFRAGPPAEETRVGRGIVIPPRPA